MGSAEEGDLEKNLPIDAKGIPKAPWMLHSLTVNTLNFCSFALCVDGMAQSYLSHMTIQRAKAPKAVLIAVPNTVNSNAVGHSSTANTLGYLTFFQIDIFQLPSENRAAVILADRELTTGMSHHTSDITQAYNFNVCRHGYGS